MTSSNSASSSSKSGGTGVIPVQTAPMDGTSPRDAAINYTKSESTEEEEALQYHNLVFLVHK